MSEFFSGLKLFIEIWWNNNKKNKQDIFTFCLRKSVSANIITNPTIVCKLNTITIQLESVSTLTELAKTPFSGH